MTGAQMEQVGLYVLGLLDGEDLVRFEATIASDREVADAVTRLQRHMLALDDTVGKPAANPQLWAAIEAGLETQNGTVVPLRTRPKRNLAWLPLAASVVVALGVGYFAGSMSATTSPQPVMIAVLLNEADAAPGAIIEAFADNSVRLVPLEDFQVPQGQILQVWTLPDVATGPVSLGTFSDPATIRLAGANLPQPQNGQLYEITLEPAPGSPTGRPTGPILVKGFAKAPQ
ncbi:anti-sigma factor [Devosia sp. SL43]|uniref:anti-sigma factor n=1 Tax=Devosia sp. SL43 TaxID=2806348 RepID=UPI001F008047|nr:anti-sigma factor [Devosia sp. SL43]UJW86750.1 anti-sigma factor [Devosia sp. SL43]